MLINFLMNFLCISVMPNYKFFAIFLVFISLSFLAKASDKTPVLFQPTSYNVPKHVKTRPWKEPDYSKQISRLGYSKDIFKAQTPLIQASVNFWFDVYSKYNTDQGILHDSLHESLIYEIVNFKDIMGNPNSSLQEKEELRLRRVNKIKKEIREILLKLSKVKNPSKLKKKEKRYWNLFKNIKEKNKFLFARTKNRLRFQLGQRDLVLKGIFNSGAYIQAMEDIFKRYNLPIELTRLVFVESSFNLSAYSKANAKGIWQFLLQTAKPFLRINASVDERLDPLRATEAAAQLLKKNYQHLNSWPLAITAYNRGLSGVKRILKKTKSKNPERLLNIRKGYFRFASANFYTSFLAMIKAEKQLGKKAVWRHPLEFKRVKLRKTISSKALISWFHGNKNKAQEYNRHIRNYVWRDLVRIGKGNFIYIPKYRVTLVRKELKQLKSLSLYRGRLYKIKKHDTLSSISRKFKVSTKKIKKANPELKERFLKRNYMILIPKK